MYVVFRKRERETSNSLYAYLMESVREAEGPRQQLVCYLGGIREDKLSEENARIKFWTKCFTSLNPLVATGSIDAHTYADVIEKLLTVVPLEDEALNDIAGVVRDMLQLFA
jgi:hypothetical protein